MCASRVALGLLRATLHPLRHLKSHCNLEVYQVKLSEPRMRYRLATVAMPAPGGGGGGPGGGCDMLQGGCLWWGCLLPEGYPSIHWGRLPLWTE